MSEEKKREINEVVDDELNKFVNYDDDNLEDDDIGKDYDGEVEGIKNDLRNKIDKLNKLSKKTGGRTRRKSKKPKKKKKSRRKSRKIKRKSKKRR